jgi:hypothetical protein
MLWMYQRVFYGEVTHEVNRGLKDLVPREIVVFAPLIVMVFLRGVYSKPIISRMEPSVTEFVQQMNYYRDMADSGGGERTGWEAAAPQPSSGTDSGAGPESASDDSHRLQTASRHRDADVETESSCGGGSQ